MNEQTNWDNTSPAKFLLQLADTLSEKYGMNTRYTEYENGSAGLIVADEDGGIEIILGVEDVIIYFDDDSDKTIQASIEENATYSTTIYRYLSINECLLHPLAATITDAIVADVIES